MLVGVLMALAQLWRLIPAADILDRFDGVRQTGQQQHEGRSPGIHWAVSQAGRLHDGLLGAEGGGSGDRTEGGGRIGSRLLQRGPGGRGSVPGHGPQGACHRAGDCCPGGIRHGLVGVDEFNGTQTGGVGGISADIREGGQRLGDQEARVPTSTAHGTVGCGAGDLGGVCGPAQTVEGVGGRTQGEQDVGSRVGIRHREDIEDIDKVPGLIGDDLGQRDPTSHCGPVQCMGVRDRSGGAVSLRLRHFRLPCVLATTTPCVSRCERLMFRCMICKRAGVQRV